MHLGRSWWPSSPPSPSLTPSNHPPKKMITRKKNHTLCPLSHSCQQWVFRGKLLQALMRLKEELGQESAPVCAGLELVGVASWGARPRGKGLPPCASAGPSLAEPTLGKRQVWGPQGLRTPEGDGPEHLRGNLLGGPRPAAGAAGGGARARASPEVEERWAAGSCKSTWRAGGVLSVAGGRGAVASRWGGTGKGLPSALPAERGGAGAGDEASSQTDTHPRGRVWPRVAFCFHLEMGGRAWRLARGERPLVPPIPPDWAELPLGPLQGFLSSCIGFTN